MLEGGLQVVCDGPSTQRKRTTRGSAGHFGVECFAGGPQTLGIAATRHTTRCSDTARKRPGTGGRLMVCTCLATHELACMALCQTPQRCAGESRMLYPFTKLGMAERLRRPRDCSWVVTWQVACYSQARHAEHCLANVQMGRQNDQTRCSRACLLRGHSLPETNVH